MFEINGKHTTAKVMIDDVEEMCISQITHFVNHPAFTNPVAIMPDTHAGKGSVIGFTMKITDKVIPNVGVDIGCGMRAIKIGKEMPVSLEELDEKVRKAVPFGTSIHNRPAINMERDFPWERVNNLAKMFSQRYRDEYGKEFLPPTYNMKWFEAKIKAIGGDYKRMVHSLGTLGGGNHFIETGLDDDKNYWITIHTGSRNFGKRICDYHQDRAIEILRVEKKEKLENSIKQIKAQYSGEAVKREIDAVRKSLGLDYTVDMKGCEWLEDADAMDYLYDMIFAQVYAEVNRDYIAKIILKVLGVRPENEIETVHNFIDFKDFVIRKGAIRSYEGEQMIIPFNMRDGILLCEGKSNEEWNCSAPHGAGRVMSRAKAKKEIDIETFKEQMDGIYSTSVCKATLDEAPDAYKDAAIIEEAIEPTATILTRIKPIHNMKDSMEFRKR